MFESLSTKTCFMKTFLPKVLGIIILCIFFVSAPQIVRANSVPEFKTSKSLVDTSADWVLQSELNGVKAFYQVSACDSVPVIFLKFINSNEYDVKIDWDDQVKVVGDASPRRTKTFSLSLTVKPGAVAGITCDNPAVVELVSKPYLPADAVIEAFVFLNLTVTQK